MTLVKMLLDIIYMYIFFSFLCYFIFFNNFSNFFCLLFLFFILVYFFNMKNLVFFLENYSFNEDKLIILLENITRIEYNYFFILLFLSYLYFILFSNINFTMVIVITVCLLNLNYCFAFQDFYSFLFQQFRFNTKLLNGLFLIHPFIVYFFYASIIGLSFLFLYWFKFRFYFSKFQEVKYFSLPILKYLLCISFFGIFAIMLGSWWAFQEINWNGWWSWDLIEIVNLLLILNILGLIHRKKILLKSITLFSFSSPILSLFFLPLFFMGVSRFNLVNSLHSFVLLDNFSQFYFIVEIFLLILFFTILVNKIIEIRGKVTPYFLNNCDLLNNFFYVFFIIFFYKLLYELFIFFFNLQSFLEYFYYFKHYLNFLIIAMLTIVNSYILNFSFFFFNFFLISFIEVFLIFSVFLIFYKKSWSFFKWHFLIFTFILINFFNFYVLEFFYKSWVFNFMPFIENFKLSYNFTKTEVKTLVVGLMNLRPNSLYYYSILTNDSSLIQYGKSNLYFLSNFSILDNFFTITSYKFFFYYNFLFTKYLAL
nr:heme maturase [Pseudocohnilembus persalinus]